jgi:D-beta-D-heptose 7-phosphate kinase / D-beta-D-heptose 1-phosphate adenosyltransferase
VTDLGRLRGAVTAGFEGRRALVVGDVMLDRYLAGRVARISPEAPVPVVRLEDERVLVGGSGNVATNLAALGLRVTLGGWTGDDAGRPPLLAALSAAGVDTALVTTVADRPTTTKTRVLANRQQLVRIDDEQIGPLDEPARGAFDASVLAFLDQRPDVIVLSDYAKGVLSDALCRALIARAADLGIPILVDPKSADFSRYARASAVTPNEAELAAACRVPADDGAALEQAAAVLRAELDVPALVVTRGERGMTVFDEAGAHHVTAQAREVFDVSGAGDTAVAALAAAAAAGLGWPDAAEIANAAAGVAVSHTGTVAVTGREVADALAAQDPGHGTLDAKVHDLDTVREMVERWRSAGDVIGFTNGCFDLLHAGHVSYLDWARGHCDHLVVGVNTDATVRDQKGPGRPVVPERERAAVLAGLAAVDAVVLFAEPTPLALITALRPDVLVKGGDYREADVVGAAEVRSWGGQVLLAPLVEGRSTTALVGRAREAG